jgi:phenylpropionate dioxygenase-like ring-hydroxylating dioxygenase large terminal subunit
MPSVLSGLRRGVASALPGWDCRGPAGLGLGRRRVFQREWFCAGRGEQARERGDCLVVEVTGESILVVRGNDLALRCLITSPA